MSHFLNYYNEIIFTSHHSHVCITIFIIKNFNSQGQQSSPSNFLSLPLLICLTTVFRSSINYLAKNLNFKDNNSSTFCFSELKKKLLCVSFFPFWCNVFFGAKLFIYVCLLIYEFLINNTVQSRTNLKDIQNIQKSNRNYSFYF